MTIERDADDIALLLPARARLLAEVGDDEVFEGEVVGLIGAGAFVAFGERGSFEGLLPVRRLRGDWWELNEQGTIAGRHAQRRRDPPGRSGPGAGRADRRAAG